MESHETIYHRTTNYTQMRNVRIGFGVLVAATMLLLTACENEQDIDSVDETLNYECENLEADFGDVCVFTTDSGNTVIYGLVDTNCVCANSEEFFCNEVSNANPNYPNGYMGAQCYTVDEEQGTISENCVCVSDSITSDWDCPLWDLNVGDACADGTDINGNPLVEGFLDENCVCIEEAFSWDCPDLQANVADSCFSINGLPIGVISADCECVTGNPDWDCPVFPGNVGDPCQNGWGVITADCDCVEDNVQWDCPGSQANIGDVCIYTDTLGGAVNTFASFIGDDCYCITPDFDCPDLQLFIGMDCQIAGTNDFGTVSADCECE
jgi:hypothetical protein